MFEKEAEEYEKKESIIYMKIMITVVILLSEYNDYDSDLNVIA